jgi:tellurite resistance protein
MGIAVDQTRLRRIVESFLAGSSLDRAQATTLVQIAQVAAGADLRDDPAEQALLHAVAQHVGLKPGELLPIPPLPDEEARLEWIGALSKDLRTHPVRELAFALAFLMSVADLELVPAETEALEEFQRALGVDHRRATDVVVLVTEIVAAAA